jgi:transposase-like protein
MDKEITTPRTLQEALVYFSNPDTAHRYAMALRWPDGVVTCPRCGSKDVWTLASVRQWKCKVKHPGQKFTVKIGSIMEDSPLGLDKWLAAIWLIATCKNGISSYEIHRGLGVTQKSGWFLLQRIRLAMQTGTFAKMGGKGGGPIEVDETFIGGKARFMHAHKRAEKIHGTGGSGKVAVMGLLSRHGHGGKAHSTVRVQVVNTRKRAELDAVVRLNVVPGSEVMTDELPSYN